MMGLFGKKKIGGKTAEEWFKWGYEERNLEKAVEYYTMALEIDPKYVDAWMRKGLALDNLKRYKEAIKCYDKALEIHQGERVAWFFKGNALDDLGRYEEAIKCYDKVLEIDPEDGDAWRQKGIALYMSGKYDEAIKSLDNALERYPKSVDAWTIKAKALHDLGRYEEAIGCYDKALEIDPNLEIAKENKKLAEEKLREKNKQLNIKRNGFPSKGEVVVGTVIEIKDLGAFVSLDEYKHKEGLIHISEVSLGWTVNIRDYLKEGQKVVCEVLDVDKRGHIDLSIKSVLKEVLNIINANPNGILLEEVGEKLDIEREQLIRPAIELLDKGKIRVEGDNYFPVKEERVGEVKEKKEERIIERKTAEEWLDDVLEIYPKDASAWYNKGNALGKLGRYGMAIRCYDKALDIYPKYEKAKNNRKIAEEKLRGQKRKEKKERKKVLNAIGDAQSILQRAKNLGMNTKTEEEKLNNAKLKNFSNATKLANECKSSLNEKINEYKEAAQRNAKQSLDFAYSKIREAAKFGLTVPNATNLHEKALSEFDNREYEKAIEYAEKCKKAAEEEISKYNHTKEQIEASKDIIKSIKKLTPIPKAEELIKKAESAVKVGNYANAVKYAKQAEGVALRVKKDYEAYKETTDFIFSIESEITKTKNSGVKISKSDDLVEEAKAELSNSNFERAKELANEAKSIALEKKESCEKALDSISSTTEVINDAKRIEIDVSRAEELLNNAKNSLDEGKYKDAFEVSKQAEEETLRLKKEHEAYIKASDFISIIHSEIMAVKNSGVKTPKSDDLIEQAKSELNKNNFERAKESAKKARSIALERRESREKALNSISSVDAILSGAKGYGMVLSNAEEILKTARKSLNEGEYEEAYNSSKEAERIAKETDTKYREAMDWINSAEATIEKAKKFCNVSEATNLLDNANSAFSEGSYDDAIKYAKQAEETAKKIREESKPEIEVDLLEKTFKPNYWKTLNLNIRNKGKAHAKDVKIEFSKEFEVKGLKELSVNSGEEKKLSIVLKPNELGDVPLDVKTSYKDADGKEYAAEKSFILSVGEVAREERKERRKAPAFFPEKLEDYYSEVQHVGEGGFASVFKAVREGREVAVKIPINLDRETGRSFTKEILSWNMLEHENIVRLYDSNILPVPYLEMELCEYSLEEKEKPMPVEEASRTIFEIAKGLKHAHKKGIIHRDLKPSNILFNNGKIKIADWGLSKARAKSKSFSAAIFSAPYAAPEQVDFIERRFGKTDEKTDIWQLGIIFYELVTGKLPFKSEDATELMHSIINESPSLPSEIKAESKQVEHIIMKCLAKRKEERYQSVDELLENLAVYLKEEYKKSRDFRKSAFFLYELLLHSVERGDTVEAVGWATEGLVNYPKRRYSEKEVQMLKNSVKVLMEIKNICCNENTKVRDVNGKYDILRDNLVERDFVEGIAKDECIGMVVDEMNAALREDERIDKFAKKLEYFCTKFTGMWIARFLR